MSNAEFLKPIRDFRSGHLGSTADHTIPYYQLVTQRSLDDLAWITTTANPNMIVWQALQLWDYGLDQLYIQNWHFRKLYDLWCTTSYCNLPFDTFLIKCGIQLTDLEAVQTAIVDSIFPGTSTSTSASIAVG